MKVANVSFLNGSAFSCARDVADVEYLEANPNECSRMLREGEVDVALMPTAEYLLDGRFEILPYGIVSDGAVDSVRLVSSKKNIHSQLEGLETVQILVDDRSRTSINMLKILISKKFPKLKPQYISINVGEAISMIETGQADFALLIGDHVLKNKKSWADSIDMGELWSESTGLPFVYAIWAKKSGLDTKILEQRFASALSSRVKAKDDDHGFDEEVVSSYLNSNIQYRIGDKEQRGIDFYHQLGFDIGIFPRRLKSKDIESILNEASEGRRISVSDGLSLARCASIEDLQVAADQRRKQLHPSGKVSYIVDRNINYTNVCNVYCSFCAFYSSDKTRKGAYVLSKEELSSKIDELVAAGGIQVLLQGGVNPDLKIEYYEDLFSWLKNKYPNVNLHALSADEVMHICEISNLSLREGLGRLIKAGLGSLPGAGAEILIDRVRKRIARLKSKSQKWLDVHKVAHMLGITSTCTMMYAVDETWEDRIMHMDKLRQLQDITGGFTAFIAWPFQPDNTALKTKNETSPNEYLRVQAVARLFLDNINNIQSSWVTQGPEVGKQALLFGANDFGSVMFEENVVSAAGTTFKMDSASIEDKIKEAGFEPFRRDVHYNSV